MVNFTMLVRNRFLLTAQALVSLKDQKEVTILDDRSEPRTASLVSGWATATGNHSFTTVQKFGTGPNRNNVIQMSQLFYGRGDYLYLSDNDVFFQPGWLEILIDCYEAAWSSGCRVLGAVGHPYHQQGDTLGICSFTVRYAVKEVLAQPLQSMLMRWEVWDKYGPFCETPEGKVCQGEDVDFTNKIKADGGKIGVVSPALVVNTGITNSFGEKIPGWEMVKAQCPSGVICE